jgi:hypothetical protein
VGQRWPCSGARVTASWQRILLVKRDGALFRRLEGISVEVSDDAGDVVVASSRIREVDQAFGKLRERAHACHFLSNGLVMNETAQTIGAQQHPITASKLDEGQIDRNLLGGAQRLQDDIGVLEGVGLVFGELPGFDQLIDERLVFGDQVQSTVSQDVATAVTDLPREEHLVDEACHRCGGSHPAARSVFLGREVNTRARFFDGVD